MVWLLANFRTKILAFAVVITTDPRPERKCETSTDHEPQKTFTLALFTLLALLFFFNIQISFGISLFLYGIKYFWHIFLYYLIILAFYHSKFAQQ